MNDLQDMPGDAELQLSPKKNDKRRHLWEISKDLFCSICGTCLSMGEQKMILKKLHIDAVTFTDHQIHALMVQSAHSENKLSRRLDSHLNKKYHYEISRFASHNEEQFMAVWNEHMRSGDICGLYWLAVTHPDLSDSAMSVIYNDVHMLSHLNGGTVRKEKAECERLTKLNADLTAKLQQMKKERKELLQKLAAAEKAQLGAQAALKNLNKTSDADSEALASAERMIEALKNDNENLQNMLNLVQSESRDYREQIRDFEKEKEQLLFELAEQKEINMQLYLGVNGTFRGCHCDEVACAHADCNLHLCEKRVLIVGGITKLKEFYRDLVEKQGGRFEYHDGHLRSGERELENLIRKSDIILCPVDCNSHGACLCVKKICNRINKPYKMLPSSSLSSISQALTARA